MHVNNLELYKIFYTVASVNNMTKAAEMLFMGQPAVSKAIRRLEETLQTSLFIRNKKGVILTTDGQVLFEHVERAIRELGVGEYAVMKNVKNTVDKLKLGVSAPIYKVIIQPNLKGFLDSRPNIAVSIVDNSKSHEIIEDVKTGVLDIGVVTKPPVKVPQIEFIPIANMDEIVVASPGYLSRMNTSDVKSFLESITFISIETGNIMRDYSELYLHELRKKYCVNVKPEIETSNMNYIIELVNLEAGIGIVYAQMIEQELQDGKLVNLNFLPGISPRDICIALKKNRLRSVAINEFVTYYLEEVKLQNR